MDYFNYCENIIAENSVGFHKAFQLLSREKAQAVFAIYAFCRRADDAADVEQDAKKLETLEKNIRDTFDGKTVDDPVFMALKDTFKRFPSELKPYLELLEGMRDDLDNKPIETEKDFDDYCYKAASTVGLMLLPVIASQGLKKQPDDMKGIAIELGKAMQITNILRDVRDDLMKDRVYFPNETLEQFSINIEILRTGLVIPEWRVLVEHYIRKAKDKYQVFYDNVGLFDDDAIYPTYLAARFYEAILDQIARKDYSNLNKRHATSKLKKFFIMRKARKDLKNQGLLE